MNSKSLAYTSILSHCRSQRLSELRSPNLLDTYSDTSLTLKGISRQALALLTVAQHSQSQEIFALKAINSCQLPPAAAAAAAAFWGLAGARTSNCGLSTQPAPTTGRLCLSAVRTANSTAACNSATDAAVAAAKWVKYDCVLCAIYARRVYSFTILVVGG